MVAHEVRQVGWEQGRVKGRAMSRRVERQESGLLGELLRQYRQRLGLSQEELAERVIPALSVTTIGNLERGRTRPYRHTLIALCVALALTAEERAAALEVWRAGAAAAEVPPPAPPATKREASLPDVGGLPVALTPLVGREYEEAAVAALLQRPDVRLVTLSGPGGVGKTRLAQQVAATLAGAFAHGTVTISLAALREPDLFLATLAQALGMHESGAQPLREQLTAHLRDQELLLLLDNFEQLTAAAPLVTDLLGACPALKALVTSRVRLRVRGEHEFAVPPLALPDPAGPLDPSTVLLAPAVALFVQRARAYRPTFTVDGANAQAVVTICRRLDGLPLALELASARLKLFSPQALLARLGDRLALLTGGAQDMPERHQTLRATLAWSYDLLPEAEQALFRRLSAFAGGCTLESAEAVCADPDGAASLRAVSILDGLTSLVDQHLLQADDGPEGEPRFAMLETIREYATERLRARGEAEEVRGGHAAYYRQLAEEAEAGLRGPEQTAWFHRLDRELDNIRSALAWALERGHVETALGTATPLALFWFRHGHLSEGRRWLMQGLASSVQVSPKMRADALAEEGWLAWAQGDWQEAMTLAGESLAIARGLGEKWRMADALNTLGAAAAAQEQYEQAAEFYQESLALHQELGDQRGVAVALSNRGQVALYQGDLEQAAALLGTCLSAFEEQGERWYSALTRSDLGSVALAQGDHRRAAALYAESLAAFREQGDMWGSALVLEAVAEVAHAEGAAERAICLYGAAASLRKVTGSPSWPADRAKRERVLAAIHAEIDDVAFATAWEQGLVMALEEAIAYALENDAAR
jgi:predicted ATPase/transcriptional regulator with XRE-family HTH domain